MSGPAPKPDADRRRRNEPQRPWVPTEGVGWQHGKVPACPSGLMTASRDAWRTWMAAWFASHWTPDDVPGLRQLIRLYDQVERGEFHRHGELRIAMDTYGITPKGQQDRRWQPPKTEEPKRPAQTTTQRYAHLRSVAPAV